MKDLLFLLLLYFSHKEMKGKKQSRAKPGEHEIQYYSIKRVKRDGKNYKKASSLRN